jgi:hypothetical protein
MASRKAKHDGDAPTTSWPKLPVWSGAATLHQLGRIEFVEWFALDRAKAGDFGPLFDHIRARLSPPIVQEVIDLIEGRRRRPAHRIRNPEIVKRDLGIAFVIRKRLNEGVSLSRAKGLAAQEFKISKFTVRNVCKEFRELIFAKRMPEETD